MTALGWQPAHGGTVHLAQRNSWALPAGRYRLDHHGGGAFDLVHVTSGEALAVNADTLRDAESAGLLTPISPAEIDRERQMLQLRALAPMRGRRGGQLAAQFGTEGLSLFAASDQPGLF